MYRQVYQYRNVSPTTIVAPLVVGVVKSPANNSVGLASLEVVHPFSLRIDSLIRPNMVPMKGIKIVNNLMNSNWMDKCQNTAIFYFFIFPVSKLGHAQTHRQTFKVGLEVVPVFLELFVSV